MLLQDLEQLLVYLCIRGRISELLCVFPFLFSRRSSFSSSHSSSHSFSFLFFFLTFSFPFSFFKAPATGRACRTERKYANETLVSEMTTLNHTEPIWTPKMIPPLLWLQPAQGSGLFHHTVALVTSEAKHGSIRRYCDAKIRKTKKTHFPMTKDVRIYNSS